MDKKKALDEYVRDLHPVSPGEYDQNDIIRAFEAGFDAGTAELDEHRCPICRRIGCVQDHGY